jgi:hypothetical protein
MLKKLWSDLISLNRQVDALVEVVDKVVLKSAPISREIPVFASAELLFSSLPPRYSSTVLPASELSQGQNQKLAVFQNGGSRIYIRELSFALSLVNGTTDARRTYFSFGRFPPNFRWNFYTSITNRRYADKPVMARSAGRNAAGVHIAFRDPLVLEPREALNLEVELLSFGMSATQLVTQTGLCIEPSLSGYREAI